MDTVKKSRAFDKMEKLILNDQIDLFSRMTFLKQIISHVHMQEQMVSQWEGDEDTVIVDFNT